MVEQTLVENELHEKVSEIIDIFKLSSKMTELYIFFNLYLSLIPGLSSGL